MSDSPEEPSTDPVDPVSAFPERLGPCRLERLLGAGAMGSVFRAQMLEDRPYAAAGATVAVKVLHPRGLELPGALPRFLREAELGKAIRHPSVVGTYDAGADTSGPRTYHYLVLEYVHGQTLATLITQLRTLPEALVRDLAAQIAAGLEAVHGADAVHRDLKPTNILITPDHQVKLMDLGIAQVVDSSLSLTGNFAGTLLYASPEQFSGETVGPAADLYSLGVILYEAATGTQPFAADRPYAVMSRHFLHVPPKVGQLVPQLSPFFEEAVAKLLQKEPDGRFASAAELHGVFEEGEASSWWRERERALRASHPRGELRRMRPAEAPPLVGREAELQTMRRLYGEAKAGAGRLVILEGEPGIGKTRLLEEFIRWLEDNHEDVQVLSGANPPGGIAGGPVALSQAVVDHFGERGLESAVDRYLGAAPGLKDGFTALLAGAPPPTGSENLSSDAVHAAFCHLAKALAAERPLVWVVEDLHFGRAESRALLLSLARVAHDQRLFIIATTRPGLPPEELALFERLPITRRHAVARLSPREVVELLRQELQSAPLADRLVGEVAYKSDGNPFFVLEILRTLRETDVLRELPDGSYEATGDITDVGVPSSVRGLLSARIKDVPEEDRALLEVAAVQGVSFDPDLIARVLERRRLEVLQTLAGIERRTGIVRATGAGFRFDHLYLQELLYEGLPPVLRAEYHALIADAFADRGKLAGKDPAAVPGDAAVFLVQHYLRGERQAEGNRFVVRALDFLEAGFQHEALLELAELALDALSTAGDDDPGLRCDLRLRQASCLDLLGQRPAQREALEEAFTVAEAAGDGGRAARARQSLGWLLYSISEYGEAREVLADAAARARDAGDVATAAQTHRHLGSVLRELGRPEEARAELEESLTLSRAAGDPWGEARATNNLGIILLDLGHYDEARVTFERHLTLSRKIGDRRDEARAIGNLALALHLLGRTEESLAEHQRHMALSSEIGYRRGEAIATGNIGGVYEKKGQLDLSREHYEKYLEQSLAIGNRLGEAIALLNLGSLGLQEGRLDEACERLTSSLEVCRVLGAKPIEADVLHGLADLARAGGQVQRARELYQEALTLRRELGSSDVIAASALALGRHLFEQGDVDSARPLLVEADTLLAETDVGGSLPGAYLALLGDRDPADVAISDASPAAARAEAHLVLHRAGATRGDHARKAGELLRRLSAHLSGAELEQFERNNPTARAYHAIEL